VAPRRTKINPHEVLVAAANTNILGFDLLYGRVRKFPSGSVWRFARQEIKQNNKYIRNVHIFTTIKNYTISAAAQLGVEGVVKGLENRGMITCTHSPYNSLVGPVKTPNWQWKLRIDYRHLNASTAPLTAAVLSTAELVTQIQGASDTWVAALEM